MLQSTLGDLTASGVAAAMVAATLVGILVCLAAAHFEAVANQTGGIFRLRTSFIHGDIASAQRKTMQGLQRRTCSLFRSHGDKGASARNAGGRVAHQFDFGDSAMFGK